MFYTDQPGYSWQYKFIPTARRKEIVKMGFYVIEHVPTGFMIANNSNNVNSAVDNELELLAQGRHPCRKLQARVNIDNELRVYEYPAISAVMAKQYVKAIKNTVYPLYCLGN